MQRPVAIITGGATGIGAATGLLLAERGYDILVNCSRNVAGAQSQVERIIALGGDARYVAADIADDANCRKVADAALEQWGRIDTLIHSAGQTVFASMGDLDALSADDFYRIYGVNVVGAYQMARAVAPALARSPIGSIVMVSSIAALNGTGSSYAYAASKGALNTLTMALARNLAPIRVNAVLPGVVDGDWLRRGLGDEGFEQARNVFEEASALGRLCTPKDIASAIAWMASEANVVTGQLITADAGALLGRPPQVVPR